MRAVLLQRNADRILVIFVAILTLLVSSSAVRAIDARVDGDERWWDGFGLAPGQGIAGNSVDAFCVYGDRLIVGGDYWPDDGGIRFIRAWDGSSWTALGSGVNGGITAMCANGSDLYVGGTFTIAGGASAFRIARWDGSAWHPLGTGVDGDVLGMAIDNGDLVVAGSFSHAGGVSTPNRIARWDGLNWSAMGTANAWTWAGAVHLHGGVLYAGTSVGPRRWNGSEWVAFGPSFDGGVTSLTTFNGSLIASGTFMHIGTSSIYFIASWSGTSWSPLGPGLGNLARGLCVYDGDLIAGGEFGSPGAYVARWDGSAWLPLGSGLNSYVRAVCPWGGDLYVGGMFDQAGGKSSWKIARWIAPLPDAVPLPSIASGTIRLVVPNPYLAGGTIRVESDGPIRSAFVYDLNGRRISSLLGGSSASGSDASWSLRWYGQDDAGGDAPAGVYFLSVSSDREKVTRQIVRVR